MGDRKMNNDLMFSSKNQQWATRWETFKPLNEKYGFTLDVCSSVGEQKCDRYYTPENDGLTQSWNSSGEIFWCNPPYGREQINWVRKGVEDKATGMFLLPSRTDTKLFHEVIVPSCRIEFIKGRITFGSDAYWAWVWEQEELNGKPNSLYKKYGKMNAAPFPSMLVFCGELK